MEAIVTIAGSSLEQTTWLRRNLEVKASPQIIVDGANLEADVEGIFIQCYQSKLLFVYFETKCVMLKVILRCQ